MTKLRKERHRRGVEAASRAAIRAADQDPLHEPLRPDRDDAAVDPAEPEAERLQELPLLPQRGGGEDPRSPTVGLFSSPPFPRPYREIRGKIVLVKPYWRKTDGP